MLLFHYIKLTGDNMRKFFLTFITVFLFLFVALLAGAGYLIGDYFVAYTLKRGNISNPTGPPTAYVEILGARKGPVAQKPHYPAENWQITSQDGLKLQATHFTPNQPGKRWAILVHEQSQCQKCDYSK